MIEQLPNEEKKIFGYYIDDHADVPRKTDVDFILREWDRCKSIYLNKIFKNNLILSKPIKYTRGKDELYDEIHNTFFCYTPENNTPKYRQFIERWRQLFYKHRWMEEYSEEEMNMFQRAMELIDSEVLAEDAWMFNPCEIKLPKMEKALKLQPGTHPMKVIRKIAEIYDIEYFEEFRIKHSQILNQKTLKGDLHISIHPLDYATMSDNDCGWSSCMSWEESGCYRQGTVEMMNSSMVIVAYLASSSPMDIHGMKWSNKKWRQLFIIKPEGIFNIKAYPYFNETLTIAVMDWLKELATEAGIGTYHDELFHYDKGEEFESPLFSYGVDIWPRTYMMYNDFGCDQLAYLTNDKNLYDGGTLKFNYSGKSECMSCGELTDRFQNEEALSCSDCFAPKRCSVCGCELSDDEGWYIDDEWYCEDCVDENCYVDKITEEYHSVNTGEKTIYVASNNGQSYYPDFYITIEDYTFRSYLKNYLTIEKPHFMDHNTFYVRRDELNEKGIELFFSDEFYNWRENKIIIPPDEEMIEDFFVKDIWKNEF